MPKTLQLSEHFGPAVLENLFTLLNDVYHFLDDYKTWDRPQTNTRKQRAQEVQNYFQTQEGGPQVKRARNGKWSFEMTLDENHVHIETLINLKATYLEETIFGTQKVQVTKEKQDKPGLLVLGTRQDGGMPTLVVVK